MNRATILSIAFLAMYPTVVMCAADTANQAEVAKAGSAAQQWLKLVDDGNYQASYDQASSMFKSAIKAESWAQRISAARKPLGALESRKVKASKYFTSLPGAPDGQYVVIQYDTSYANKKSAIETVTPMHDKDGQWRVAGYYIK